MNGYLEVRPEKIILEEMLNELGINQDQLISLAILVGTDYNPKGIPRIGQKKALAIVKEFLTPEEIFESVKDKLDLLEGDDKFDWKEIFALFKAPQVRDFEIVFPEMNFDKIKEILIERHGFSEERIENQLEKLNGVKKLKEQKDLNKWF